MIIATAGRDEDGVFHEHLELWRLWMGSADHSARTIDARLDTLRLFARRTGADPVTCSWEPIALFLSDGRLRKRSSKATYARHLRAWFKWLLAHDVRTDNPMDRLPKIRTQRGVPRPVTTDQIGIALAANCFYRRTRTMIILGAYQGLRAHEVARFRGEQIRSGKLHIVGKGQREAKIDLHPLVAEEARSYPNIGWWFPSYTRPGQPVTDKNVSRVVAEALRRAGVDATAHQLRHWFGTELLRSSGGNLRVAQEGLRHASPATTAIYTKVDDDELAAAVRALPVPLYVVRTRRRPRSLTTPDVAACGTNPTEIS